MTNQDRIATYYYNARELVSRNDPKGARVYVLQILNEAVISYKNATSILSKAKTAVFLDKWIAISRELYDKGVTDNVRKCFGLIQGIQTPPNTVLAQNPALEGNTANADGGMDYEELIDEVEKTQGWCAGIFAANKNAVVEVRASIITDTLNRVSSGTGFIISDSGYLLTNDHVVFDNDNNCYYPKLKMSFASSKKSYRLELIHSDKKTDVALCRFDKDKVQDFKSVKLISDYSKLMQGADCLVIGNFFGTGLGPFTGVVRFTKDESGDLVYTNPTNHGDSGGPVFNRRGECIGINKSRTTSIGGETAYDTANATPAYKITELLSKWGFDANNTAKE